MEHLGFWVTHNGVKPIDLKTSNKNMKPPNSRKGVRQIIGLVNYYYDIWARYSHKLAPLTNIMSSGARFKWTKIEQDAFKEIKRIVTCNTLLS